MIKVKRLPVDTGVSGWNAILPERGPAVELTGSEFADYLVIGAGFAGLSAAERLTQLDPAAGIILLEATRIGEGPAGRNSGFMIDLPHELSSADYSGTLEQDVKNIRLNRTAIEFADALARQYQFPPDTFCRSGKVNAAATNKGLKHNENYARHLEKLGEPCELLGAQQMRELTGSSWYKGGLYTPGTAMIQPAAYVRGLAAGLSSRIQIFENSPVTGLKRDNGFWIAESKKGKAKVAKVILATNGHVENFGFFKRRLVHIILYASMTRALSRCELENLGGAENWGLTPSDPAATTVRRISGDAGTRIIIRNRISYRPSMQVHPQFVAQMGKTHDRSFADRFPQLKEMDMEYRWSGRLCLSLNSVPAFGEVGDGLYSACCQNGLGTVKGTLAGMAAAEQAVEGNTALVEQMLGEAPPSKLPPAPLDRIGANARIFWSELRAGREL